MTSPPIVNLPFAKVRIDIVEPNWIGDHSGEASSRNHQPPRKIGRAFGPCRSQAAYFRLDASSNAAGPVPSGEPITSREEATYRHGLRASEAADLRWDQVDFTTATLHVRRAKQGSPSTHPILGDELRGLRRLRREQEPKSPFVFTSERGAPFSTAGFARMVERAGTEANLGTVPTYYGFRSDNCQGAQHTRSQAIQPSKYHPVDAAEGRSLRRLAPQDIELVAKRQDLDFQRSS
jgi:hypothetical protein